MPGMDIIVIERFAGMGIRIPKRPLAIVYGLGKILRNSVPIDGIMCQHVLPRYEDGKETEKKQNAYRDNPKCFR